jgi:pimeloyl-ACP methyl ester carboxylesterase
MLRLIERTLTFKPNGIDHGGLRGISHRRVRFGNEFGFDLDGVWMPQKSSAAVLFIHGNRHNVSRFNEHYELFQALGISCFAFDFPGYGTSKGTPSEAALYASARAAHTALLRLSDTSPDNIIVYGCSLGGAVAIELVRHISAGCLITESTFTNSRAMAKHLYSWLPIRHLLPVRFANDAKVSALKLPKLFIHGEQDERVPVSMAQTLFMQSQGSKDLQLVPDAGHIDCLTRGGDVLMQKIDKFISTHTRR